MSLYDAYVKEESSDAYITPILIGFKDVSKMIGRSRDWIYKRLRSDESFPRPLQISPHSVVFKRAEIMAWIKAIEKSDSHAINPLIAARKRAAAAEIFVDQMEPINWASLINALVHLGISMKRIGLTVSVSHETVRGWRDGSVPNYEAGRKLLVMCATAGILVDSSGKARV